MTEFTWARVSQLRAATVQSQIGGLGSTTKGHVTLAESPRSPGLNLPLGTNGDGGSFLLWSLGVLSGPPTLPVQGIVKLMTAWTSPSAQ